MVGKHCFSQPHHPEPRCLLQHHTAAFSPEITTLTLPTYSHTSNKNRGTSGLKSSELEKALMVQTGWADGMLEAEQSLGLAEGRDMGDSLSTYIPPSQQCCTLDSVNTAMAACAMLQFPKCQQEHMWKDVSNRCLSKGLRSHRSEREQGDVVSFIRATHQKKT